MNCPNCGGAVLLCDMAFVVCRVGLRETAWDEVIYIFSARVLCDVWYYEDNVASVSTLWWLHKCELKVDQNVGNGQSEFSFFFFTHSINVIE